MAAEWIEQTGHFWMGVGCGITDSHILLWRREKIKQWPPSTERHPALWVFRDGAGMLVASKDKPSEYYKPELYYPDSRVQDMNTDEKWYHYGYMAGGIAKDLAWALFVAFVA